MTGELPFGHPSLPVIDPGPIERHTPSIAPPPPVRSSSSSAPPVPGGGPPSLAELLDLSDFRDLCASFVELYKIGIKIFDARGTKLVDIRVGNGDWCGYIFNNPNGRVRCTNLVARIKQLDYAGLAAGQATEERCFSGLKYVITPIRHGGEQLGRVIWGPFMPEDQDRPGADVLGFGHGFDPERLWQHGAKIRRVSDDTVGRIINNFRQVLDTVVAIAMKAVLTERMHVETITASYHELAETNRALRQSVEKLKDVDRLKASFLAMISHELRTPLTSIIGYSEMLQEGMAGELGLNQREFVGIIKEKGESLLDLISAILEISKIESGALQLLIAEIDVPELLLSAYRTIVPQAQKKSLELKMDIPPDLPRLMCDRDKIGRAVVNLLANAVKFTPVGGRIVVRASLWRGARRYSAAHETAEQAEGAQRGEAARRWSAGFTPAGDHQFVRLDVEDNGIGIPADRLQDVFKAFYQVDNSFTREYGGTGLGLAIVRSYVEAHGGEVWVESVEKAGTVFTLLLPLAVPDDVGADVPRR